MIPAKLLPVKNFMVPFAHLLSCAIFFIVLSFGLPAYSDDLKCSDGSNPTKPSSDQNGGNCVWGKCGICDSNTGWDGWLNPTAEVVYQVGVYCRAGLGSCDAQDTHMPVARGTLHIGECSYINGTRFCVRAAKPGEGGNTTTRPLICAYEDPCDATDPPDGNCAAHANLGPFHHNTPNAQAMSMTTAAEWGLFGGALGAGIGAMVAAIQSTFNQVVTTNIGCIERKIGPIPPTWKNNAWFNNYLPAPTFVDETGYEKVAGDTDSVFESPRIKVKVCHGGVDAGHDTGKVVACDNVCHDGPDAAHTTGKVVDCSLRPAGAYLFSSSTYEYSHVILNPNSANGYYDCNATPTTDGWGNGRTFCARVTTTQPDKVMLTMKVDTEETSIEPPLGGFIARTGYMPKPTITEAADSTVTQIKMNVTLRGQSITLQEAAPPPAAAAANESKTLHQVTFTTQRPCSTILNADGTCTTRLNMLCLVGYNTAPYTAVNMHSPQVAGDDRSIIGAPNTLHTVAAGAFNNTHSNQEKNAYLSEAYPKKDVEVYDGITVLTATQAIRPLNGYEAGLCIYPPADMTEHVYAAGTNTTYTASNCSQIKIKVWGGGAAGLWTRASNNDYSGGAGGYVEDTFNIPGAVQDPVFNINVGSGGATIGASGTSSSVTYSASSSNWTANGGGIAAGGNAASANGTAAHTCTGGDGIYSNNSSTNGGSRIDGPSCTASAFESSVDCPISGGVNGTNQAPYGSGGCSGDDSQNCHYDWGRATTVCDQYDGSWGKGGDGKVSIQCLHDLN